MWRLAICLGILMGCSTLASADVYKCPDDKGAMRYQNMPCVGATAPVFESRPPAAPSETPAAPVHVPSPPVPDDARVLPPPPPPVSAPQAPVPAASQPVDTLQFAFITDGMSEREVGRRLGPPGKILDAPTILRRVGRDTLVEVRRYTWYYPGTNQIMSAYIYFENGRVVGKHKTY